MWNLKWDFPILSIPFIPVKSILRLSRANKGAKENKEKELWPIGLRP